MKNTFFMLFFSIAISFIACGGSGENDENLLAKKFIYSTEEFKIIKQVLFSIFGNNGINNENLLRISDLIMGMSINGLKNNYTFEVKEKRNSLDLNQEFNEIIGDITYL